MNTSWRHHSKANRFTSGGLAFARQRHQRGVIGLWWAITMMMALLFTTLALDTGRIYLEKRRLQRAADMAAMSAARYTGCGSSNEDALRVARQMVNSNGYGDNDVTLTVSRGYIQRDAQKATVFQVLNTEASNAAHVTLSRQLPFSLILQSLYPESVRLTASATAEGGPPVADFSVTSFAGVTDKQADFITSLFRGILGNSSLNLTAPALSALAGATVNLVQLQAQAGAATIDDLLNSTVPLSDLLRWIANSASANGSASAALSQIVSASVSSGLTVRVGDVLNVQVPAPSGVGSAKINVFDLVQASLMVGGPNGLINLDFGIGDSKLIPAALKIKLGARPKIGHGPAGKYLNGTWCTEAKSSQMTIIAAINLPLLASFGVALDMMETNGHLTSLNVAPGNTTGSLNVETTFFTVRLTNADDTGPAMVAPLGLPLVQVGVNLPLIEATGGSANFNLVSSADLPKAVPTKGVAGAAVSGLLGPDTALNITILGIKVPDFVAAIVKGILSPIFKLIGQYIINPLFEALGFDLWSGQGSTERRHQLAAHPERIKRRVLAIPRHTQQPPAPQAPTP
ncbi:MAG: pilus assembly protein TadG-related protein [Aquabacterium sp.]